MSPDRSVDMLIIHSLSFCHRPDTVVYLVVLSLRGHGMASKGEHKNPLIPIIYTLQNIF